MMSGPTALVSSGDVSYFFTFSAVISTLISLSSRIISSTTGSCLGTVAIITGNLEFSVSVCVCFSISPNCACCN